MGNFDLTGLGVALITPFKTDLSVDYDALQNLLEFQISNGVDYIVVLGTTGETATLNRAERAEIARFVAEKVNGRIPLVLGIGGNATAQVVADIKAADLDGYSAILSIAPFYNKPSQQGIYCHFAEVAKASPLPVILYNVPGRTGVNMTADTILRIASDFQNVVAVKEASGDINQIVDIINRAPDGFVVLSGDDSQTVDVIQQGGRGVISVVANAFPKKFKSIVDLALQMRFEQAQEANQRFAELFRLLFVDGNPAGVKCVLSKMGFIDNILRLPLVPTCPATTELIGNALSVLQN